MATHAQEAWLNVPCTWCDSIYTIPAQDSVVLWERLMIGLNAPNSANVQVPAARMVFANAMGHHTNELAYDSGTVAVPVNFEDPVLLIALGSALIFQRLGTAFLGFTCATASLQVARNLLQAILECADFVGHFRLECLVPEREIGDLLTLLVQLSLRLAEGLMF